MNSRLRDLAIRKNRLIVRCAAEREQWAGIYRRLRTPIKIAATLIGAVQVLKARPEIIIAISSLAVKGRGATLGKAVERAIMLVQIYRPLRAWWSRGHP